jgi:phosphatidylinositol alpha 1,6-mannosyltransferase
VRIALVCETFLPDVNGVAATVARLLTHLQQHGHQVLLIAPHGAPAEYAGARIVTLPGLTFPLYPELRLTLPNAELRRALRRFRPDLIHLVGPVVLGAAVPEIGRRMNVPVISSYHTDFAAYCRHYGAAPFAPLMQAWLRGIHNRCALTLAPSTWTIDRLRADGFRRLRLWARGVDTARFTPHGDRAGWRARINAAPHETVLLSVGRLAHEKRLDLLLEVLPQLTGARLVFVGDGPAREDLVARAQGLPVHFCGYLRGADLAAAYAGSDLFVFPSDTDTFGQVVQEALAAGLPVAAARAGGAADLIQDGVNGRLFTPNDRHALRQTLQGLLADRQQLQGLAANARRTVEQRRWPVVLDELLGLYTTVVTRHQRRLRLQLDWMRRSALGQIAG